MATVMRRRQRSFNVAARVSAYLAVVTMAVWLLGAVFYVGASYQMDRMHHDGHGRSHYDLEVYGGGVEVKSDSWRPLPEGSVWASAEWVRGTIHPSKFEWVFSPSYPEEGDPFHRPILGFVVWSVHARTRNEDTSERGFVVPCWSMVILFGIVPTIWLIKRRKRGGANGIGCHACGYNLTGNASGTCPECGVEIVKA